jgi:citronellol/citronellal dehydrogenase
MADAAYTILTKPSGEATGNFFLDDEVLRAAGVTDLAKYRVGGSEEDLQLDFWVDPA